jgi:hypothetical protein
LRSPQKKIASARRKKKCIKLKKKRVVYFFFRSDLRQKKMSKHTFHTPHGHIKITGKTDNVWHFVAYSKSLGGLDQIMPRATTPLGIMKAHLYESQESPPDEEEYVLKYAQRLRRKYAEPGDIPDIDRILSAVKNMSLNFGTYTATYCAGHGPKMARLQNQRAGVRQAVQE